ncbi:MAG: YciI family protein [Cellulomonadaceae bacterium]|nr:YciI family protein [Cellulomonadaceae bacterium]
MVLAIALRHAVLSGFRSAEARLWLNWGMTIFAVVYSYRNEPAELAAIRPRHRDFLSGLQAQGHVLLSGPLAPSDGEPGGGGLIIMRAPTESVVAALLDDDPFQVHGLIAARRIARWQPVIGEMGLLSRLNPPEAG